MVSEAGWMMALNSIVEKFSIFKFFFFLISFLGTVKHSTFNFWVTLHLYLSIYCFFSRHNLAFNRMTRMLSNLSKINCYNKTNRNEKLAGEIMLKSAKENLLNFSFFGILEEQEKTQFLFENTFGIRFIESLKPKPITHVSQLNITRAMHDAVVDKTRLDIQLYQFAKDLFLQRVESMEAHLGYTVEDYFNSARNSAKKVEKVVPKEEEFPEENEETEEDDKQVQYPSKATVNALEPKAKR